VLAAALAGSVLIVTSDGEFADLTDRPALWQVASEQIDRSPWFGHGTGTWETLYASGQVPRAAQRSSHNQWMDVLFVSGAVGAALFVAMLAAALLSAGAARAGAMLALATVLMIGAAEGGWSVGFLDLLSFSLLALLLTGAARAGAAPPRRAVSSWTSG
jgi:O-antigen ligase